MGFKAKLSHNRHPTVSSKSGKNYIHLNIKPQIYVLHYKLLKGNGKGFLLQPEVALGIPGG
jgi:hypothetical protein